MEQQINKISILILANSFKIYGILMEKWMKENQDTINKYCSDCELVYTDEQYAKIENKLLTFDAVFTSNKDICVKYLTYNLKNKEKSRLKWVHSIFAGLDFFSYLEDFIKADYITLTSSKGAYNQGYSECALTGIMYFSKNMYQMITNKQNKIWEQNPIQLLQTQSVLIVGYGSIGTQLAKILKIAFGTKVVAIKRNPESIDDEARSYIEGIYGMDQLDKLMSQVDYVVNILPGTQETANIYNLDKFKQMKQSSVFINIGRGQSVVEDDLIFALKNNIIRGSALDVFQVEPLPENSELWNLTNTYITPHFGGYHLDTVNFAMKYAIQNLELYCKGQKLINIIEDKSKGY